MKILVVGGAGYIGSVLVAQLLRCGFSVRILDNLMHGGRGLRGLLSNPALEFFFGDAREERTLRPALNGMDATICLVNYRRSDCIADPETGYAINWLPICGLAKWSAADMETPRIIYASTCSVYGKIDFADETSPVLPLSPYAESKLLAENKLLEARNVFATILRFATVYGMSPQMRFDTLLNELVYAACVPPNTVKILNPNSRRPFVHVKDVVRAIILMLGRNIAHGQIFNVGGENISKKELVSQIGVLVPNMQIELVDDGKFPGDYSVSFEKLKHLGFETKYDVENGIKEVIDGVRGAARASGLR